MLQQDLLARVFVELVCQQFLSYSVLCFFFFQAEDGIRDYKVTGVQTCALPISTSEADWVVIEGAGGWFTPISERQTIADVAWALAVPTLMVVGVRLGCLNHAGSEERRVGKGCRSRGAPYHLKKKKRVRVKGWTL